ncbi:condensation domain-containing protein [Actinokineospora guangxiensis]|uniref:Condensation domain-containing protein n=1 Tax=Actinokineospora guangxiensis TaxID=1490288 RepID=A0ABW0EQQ3_9PSEU
MGDPDYERRVQALTGVQRELLAKLLDSSPPPGGETPRPEESTLARIWAQCLEIDGVGLDDDYFQLGGDSITAIVIVARATAAGLRISASDIFELRTVRELAAAAATLAPEPDDAPAPPQAEYGLTPIQQGMLFHVLADAAGTAYLAHASCTVDGPLDPEALRSACAAAVTNHPALRTAFIWDAHTPRQTVAPTARIPVDVRDLRALTAQDREAAVAAYLAEDRTRPFALSKPPLLRIGLLRVADASWVVSLVHHHLVLDGWSQQLLLRELLDALAGAPRAVDGFDFARYVAWASEHDDEAGLRYWRRRLEGFAPVAISAAAPGHSAIETTEITVDPAIADAVARRARSGGFTLSAVLYGGWALAIAALGGSEDVCFGATVAGRPATLPGATTALGNFVVTLPLRVLIETDAGVEDWLSALQRDRGALEEHQHTPLTRITRLFPASIPLFDTIAVIENFPKLVGERSSGLVISDVRSTIDEGYAVVFEAHLGPPLVLRARMDRTRFEPARGRLVLTALAAYLDGVAINPDARVGELLSAVRDAVHRDAGRAAGLLAARRKPEAGHAG